MGSWRVTQVSQCLLACLVCRHPLHVWLFFFPQHHWLFNTTKTLSVRSKKIDQTSSTTMQLMCIDWWFALTLLCWRGSFCFLCSKAIVNRIPAGGRYLWLHQIHRNSLKEGKKLASLTVSGFQSEAVGRLFCVWTCWDRSQGATSRASGARVTVTLWADSAQSSCRSIRCSALEFWGKLRGIRE